MKRPAAALLGCVAIVLVVAVAGVATIPSVPTGTWQPMGAMTTARSGAAAALLQDQRVLITGGNDGSGALSSVEVFSTDGSFALGTPMSVPREQHVAVVLQDGRVLVAGGATSGGAATNSAEIFTPGVDTWSAVAGGMVEARFAATAILLADGRVLIAGGQNAATPSQTAEIFDPVAGVFSIAGSLSAPRMELASALMSDGRVLITGGSNGNAPLGTTDIFDPTTNTISAGPALTTVRMGHSATSLLDGRVLVAGGNNGSQDLASAEIYDPANGGFAAAGTLAAPRRDHAAIRLANNNSVLIFGGTSNGNESNAVETYTPWTGAFASTGAMSLAKQQAAASALSQSGIFLSAGGSSTGTPVSSAELYGFATVKTDATDYAPGTTVTITGTGWQPGETVTLTLVESPLFDTHPVMTAVADGQGNITNNQFSPDAHDVDTRFYLTAAGSTSGFQAQNTFTDALPQSLSITSGQNPNPVQAGGSASYGLTETFNGNGVSCTVDLSAAPFGSPAWPAPPAGGFFSFTPTSITSTGSNQNFTLTIATPAGTAANTYNFVVTATPRSGTCQNNPKTLTANGTLVVVPGTVPTTLVLNSVSPNSVAFGSTGPVTLTATLTRNDTNAGVVGATVNFTVDGTAVGSAVTSAGGVASFTTYNPSALTVATHNVAAAFSASTISGTQYGASNSGTLPLNVGKATPTITWANPADIPYGTALSATQLNATASVAGSFVYTPAAGVVLNAGSGQNLHVDFTPTDGADYGSTSKDVSINVLQATPTVTVTDPMPTYDGNPHSATATAVGVDGHTAVSGSFSFTYDGSATAPTNAKTSYAVVATFTSTDANYKGATGNGTLTIKQATPTVTVTDPMPTYDGNPHNATATAVGVDGHTAVNGSFSFTYDGSATAPINAKTSYAVVATFTSTDANYKGATGNGTLTIKQATPTVTVTDPMPTYDGNPHNATATAVGVDGHTAVLGSFSFTYDGSSTAPTNAKTSYAVVATFTSTDANYKGAAGNGTLTINRRDATWTTVAESKSFGDADPSPLTTGSGSNFVPADGVTATYSRTPGEAVQAGGYHITATLSPAGVLSNYNITNGGATFTINPDNTAVSTAGAMANYGDPSVTLHATVTNTTNGVAINEGTVTFYVKQGAASFGTVTSGTVSGGMATASFPLGSIDAGTYTITASFGPSTDFNQSSTTAGTAGSLVVNQDNTSVAGSNANAIYGAPNVMLNATVSNTTNSAAVSGGTVTFTLRDSLNNVIGTASSGTVSAGSATASFTLGGSVNTGSYAIATSYSGATDFKASSSSSSATLTVTKASSSVGVTSSLNPSLLNQPVTFTATVTPQFSGTPTGTVSFVDTTTNTSLGAGVSAGPGKWTLTTSALPVNLQTITATYSGDANFTGNSGGAVQTVQYASGGVCDGDAGHQILQPINVDGSSVFNSKSTSPAKFRVCDANGMSIGTPGVVSSFLIYNIVSGTVATAVNEEVASTTPDLVFRWDPTGQQWIFNINNKSLSANQTYFFRITLNDGSAILFDYGLK